MRHNMLRASALGISLVGFVTDTQASNDITVDISSISTQSGDIGVWALSSDIGDTTVGTIPSMTEIVKLQNGAQSYIFAFVMDGTETQVETTGALGFEAVTSVFFVLRGAAMPSSATLTTDTGTGTMPNCPISDTAVVSDWILVFGHLDDEDVTPTAPANGYTMIGEIGYDNGLGELTTTMVAYKTDVSGTDNPNVFGGSGTDTWVGHTLVVSRG